MTDPKEKTKSAVPTREPKKKTQGIFDNLRKIPEPHPVEEILGIAYPATPSTPPTPSRGPSSSTPSTPSTQSQKDKSTPSSTSSPTVAPERDFTKVANSIVRAAVPFGMFGEQGGKSKELYDTLYQLTRGAVVPRRKIRIPKDELMRKAGIGSEVTLKKNLKRLISVQLVNEVIVTGAHGGNEYEVFLPEEVGLTGATPSTPSTGDYPLSDREALPPLDPRGSSPRLSSAVSTISGERKTFFKTNTENDDDDAALAGLVASLKQATKELTGRNLSLAESDRWRELADVLVAELKIAAARTTVSSVPSFLAEHLRRRLWKVDKRQARAEGTELPDEALKTTPTIDTSNCPDCAGSGWWYPEGMEKGVKKCAHEKLKTPEKGD